MNIGIIGSGSIGSSLGQIWARKGHQVFFSFSRDASKLDALAQSVPNSRACTPKEAAANSEVVLFAVRWANVAQAIEAAGSLQGKILIDCTNPLTPDMSDLAVGHTSSAAEEIAKLAPGAKVVKAFNTAFAQIYQSDSRFFGSRLPTMFYCGDDGSAKASVAHLIKEAGFEPLDSGPLKVARYLEPLAMLVIQLGYGIGMGANIAVTLIRR
jgi:8-hydroxy-5-deazaflavin:NADPH oxidoreductase